MKIKVQKAKNGSGNLYNGIYSRYGYKCFKCTLASTYGDTAIFCTISNNHTLKDCIDGRRVFRQGIGNKKLLKQVI